MGIFTRYVCAEVLKVFFVALSTLTLMFLLLLLGKEARDQGLSPLQIVQLVPYVLPDALRFTVPGTILFAACSVYGRMAGSNEVVALKSLGISPMAIMWPAFIIAAALSLLSIWLNDLAVSWGRAGVQRVVIESVDQIVYSMLRTQKCYANRHFSIIVRDVEERRLIQVTITFQATHDSPAVTITAEEAELQIDLDEMVLSIECFNGTVDVEGQGRLRFHDSIEREIPLKSATAAGEGPASPSHMQMAELPREIAVERDRIRGLRQQLAARAALELLAGDVGALTSSEWDVRYADLQAANARLFRLQTEGPRRWSSGFSCLCFVLIGAPLAVRLRNSDLMTSFGYCFLPILLVYYPLMMFGVDQAKSGSMPPYIVWLGNLIVALIGLWQLRHILRY